MILLLLSFVTLVLLLPVIYFHIEPSKNEDLWRSIVLLCAKAVFSKRAILALLFVLVVVAREFLVPLPIFTT